ncbi:oligopeptide:H+ symporter [Reichenbachiella carrageenanivorans]|uniref:Oligopeptide:H+ symporter n=1 Tax=Reichenbachiella carrageenanivorans TaxID=2979869 RepID=A0ABY6CYB6_9BACT|nr:oligopeptide:H+ symporter [Reichenbachiella carrageenanivorans]UXX78911.1 oligopeptide:H+ symporter [Reichenbachiella carrageenanivorans]
MEAKQQPELFGHPKGLFYLFFAELWERFSFYGMRALLTLYMVNEMFSAYAERDTIAFGIYASYGMLVYATPAIGGVLADRLLGFRRSVMLGAVFFTLGHFVLAIEHPIFFYTALALLIVGNGFFKPNISSFVGTLYEKGDVRRDSGFTIFYMGINVGAAVAPILCGWLGVTYGWHYGFGAAGIGMLTGLVVFWQGNKAGVFGDHGLPPSEGTLNEKVFGIKKKHMVPIAAVLIVPVIAFLIQFGEIALTAFGEVMFEGTIVSFIFNILVLGVAGYLLWMFTQISGKERQQLVMVLYMTLLMTVFWAFYELTGSLLTLFADRNVNLVMFTAAGTNGITAIFVVLLAIPFSALWIAMQRRNLNPRTPFKFAFGLILIGTGFYVLSLSGAFADEGGRVPFFFLVAAYFLFVVGELNMSPVGLSKITELTPKRLVGFMMGIWFLAVAYAFNIGGWIGRSMAINTKDMSEASGMDSLQIYIEGFEKIGLFGLGLGVVALVLAPFLKRLMHEVH